MCHFMEIFGVCLISSTSVESETLLIVTDMLQKSLSLVYFCHKLLKEVTCGCMLPLIGFTKFTKY